MSHHTRFIIVHNDGHSQSIVGNPASNRINAQFELKRLIDEEGFEHAYLQIVQVPA